MEVESARLILTPMATAAHLLKWLVPACCRMVRREALALLLHVAVRLIILFLLLLLLLIFFLHG